MMRIVTDGNYQPYAREALARRQGKKPGDKKYPKNPRRPDQEKGKGK